MNVKKADGQERLWSLNFFLLWQGQLVSMFGDVFYEMALGLWILSVTGSRALMGTILAVSALPRVFISPFAGVIVDRKDRKRIIVLMDLIRGLAIVFVGIAAFGGFIQIWMVFAAGIIMGICAAFFNPAVQSAMPDIVPESKILKANSNLGMVRNGSSFVGNPLAGFIYQILGAPIMFLFNGISYLFSAFTELFIKIPRSEKQGKQFTFKEDIKQGFAFVWNFKGLRNLILIAAFVNFFSRIATILILPYFSTNASLGSWKYGVAVSTITGGMFLGMSFTSFVNIKASKRYMVFIISGIASCLCFSAFPHFDNFILMLIMMLGAGIFNAILNVMIDAGMQLTIPQDMRGKVFALYNMIITGLTPIAMALGGIFGEFIAEQYVITTSFIIGAILFIPFLFMPAFKKFINYNPDTQSISDIA